MKNIIDTLKEIVENQNRPHLNVDLSDVNTITNVGRKNDKELYPDPSATPLVVKWIKGSYIQERGLGSNKEVLVSPSLFLQTSKKIVWEPIDSQILTTSFAPAGANILFGVQLYARNTISLNLDLYISSGIVGIYTKGAEDTDFTLVADAYSSKSNIIYLQGNVWTTVVVVYYCATSNNGMSFVLDTTQVFQWKYLDVSSPSVPEWSSIPLTRTTINEPSRQTKITLNWKRNDDIDFAGNGIYKKSMKGSGINYKGGIVGTIINTVFGATLQEDYWFYTNSNATINLGDKIGAVGVYLFDVDKKFYTKANKILNPYFYNNNSNWNLNNGGTIYNGFGGKYINKYYNLNITATNKHYSLISTLAQINIDTLYYVGVYSDNDLLSDYSYNSNGYGSSPSGWAQTGLYTMIATRCNYRTIMRINRSSGDGFFKTINSAISFSTTASYWISVEASCQKLDSYYLSFHLNAGATVYSSPTLLGERGFIRSSLKFTPSAAGAGYLKVHVLATTSDTVFNTLDFSLINMQAVFPTYILDEKLRINYYTNTARTACVTPYLDFDFNNTSLMGNRYKFLLGGTLYNYGEQVFPKDCNYITLSYIATLKSTVLSGNLNRKIYFAFLSEQNTEANPFLSLYTADSNIYRVNTSYALFDILGAVNVEVDYNIFEHVADRLRHADDGAIVSWDDFEVEDNHTYSYYLDAYDNSSFKNRSSLSTIATIYSGDTTAPKAPSGLSFYAYEGGITYKWTNPTATDFSHVNIYGRTGDLLYKVKGIAGTLSYYVEQVSGTASIKRKLKAVDLWNNISVASITGTCSPLPKHPIFKVHYETVNGTTLLPNENNWFKDTVVIAASVINNYLYTYNYRTRDTGGVDTWGAWTSLSNNKVTFSSDGKRAIQFKVIDSNSEEFESDIYSVNVDKTKPVWSDKWEYWYGFKDVPGGNILAWRDSKISDALSGLNKLSIYKSEITPLNANIGFEEGGIGTLPDNWTLTVTTGGATLIGNTDNHYAGEKSARLRFSDSTVVAKIYSSEFTINDGDIVPYQTYAQASISNVIPDFVKLALETNAGQILSSIIVNYIYSNVVGKGSIWTYMGSNYIHSGAATIAKLQIRVNKYTSNSCDCMFFDDVVAFKNPSYNHLVDLNSNVLSYKDTDIDAWQYYSYANKYTDYASNTSATSYQVVMRGVADYRDKYKNIIDNSSFERTYRTANGTIMADGWVSWYYSGQFTKTKEEDWYEVSKDGGYHGNNYVKLSSFSSGTALSCNDIHILPYTGRNRTFVYSFYTKGSGAGTSWGYIYLSGKSAERNVVKTKTYNFSVGLSEGWKRVSGTFYVTAPSICYFWMAFVGGHSSNPATCAYVDAVQLEEKDNLPASDYYESKVVTADYLQGAFIRGNWIEADSIYGGHIRANTITATNISANSITATHLRAGSVTANKIQADTITASQLKMSPVKFYKTEHSWYNITSASLWGHTRACWATTNLSTYIEHPYSIYYCGQLKTTGSIVFGVKDYNLSNQGVPFRRVDETVFKEYHACSTIGFKNYNGYMGTGWNDWCKGIIGLHEANNKLYILTNSAYDFGANEPATIWIDVWSINKSLTNETPLGTIKLVSADRSLHRNYAEMIAKSELVDGGTIYLLYQEADKTKLFLGAFGLDGSVKHNPTVMLTPDDMDIMTFAQSRQTFMGVHPDTHTIITGMFCEGTAYYRYIDKELSSKSGLKAITSYAPFPKEMSIHAGDIVCATGSILHWCLTGDNSSVHGYKATTINGTILISPHFKWSNSNLQVRTPIWRNDVFYNNWVYTYGQPAVTNPRGIKLPTGFMFIMQSTPYDADVNSYALSRLIVHKNEEYSFASLSLFDILNRYY